MTTVKDGLFQYGGVAVGGGAFGMPVLGGGAKSFFVDPANGADGDSGLKPSIAKDTVGSAYASTVDKRGDIIYYLNDGNTTGSSREATIPLVWSNDNTHLVGCCAPTMVSQRARITPVATAALTAEPVISVTGHGNSFRNLQIAHWGADTNGKAARGVDVTGNRNVFDNVHFVGIPNAHTGDEAAACDVKITGEENLFVNCVFGADTVARSTTNACVEFGSAAARNVFRNCIFTVFADNAGALFIKADGAGDLDRYTIFENCTFINAVSSTATEMTGACDIHASAGGMLVFKDCALIGAADWEANDRTNIKLMCHTWGGSDDTTADTANMGIAVNLDVTAA